TRATHSLDVTGSDPGHHRPALRPQPAAGAGDSVTVGCGGSGLCYPGGTAARDEPRTPVCGLRRRRFAGVDIPDGIRCPGGVIRVQDALALFSTAGVRGRISLVDAAHRWTLRLGWTAHPFCDSWWLGGGGADLGAELLEHVDVDRWSPA